MAITRKKKEEILAELKEVFGSSAIIIAANNLGMSVEQVSQLRAKAREAGCQVKVAKNRLMKLALSELERPGLEPLLSGPTIVVTHEEDPVCAAKVFSDFAEDCEKLEIKGGMLREEALDLAGVTRLAKLPGREQLQSEFVGMINSLIGVVYFNSQNLMGGFTGLVEAQKNKLEEAA